MSVYTYVIKMRIMVSLAYRFEVFTSIGSNLVLMFATIFLWETAYKGNSLVVGLDKNQMVTYTVMSVLLSSIFSFNTQNVLNSRISQGAIAVDFIRPTDTLLFYLAEDMGSAISAIGNKFMPLLIIASLIIGPPKPASILALLVFMISCILSFAILWILSALVGLTAFWVMELGNLGVVKDAIVRVLSGSLVPLWFFPERVQSILKYLPFQYTYQTPIGLFIGKISVLQGVWHLIIQSIWIFILGILVHRIWSSAKKNVMIQGG